MNVVPFGTQDAAQAAEDGPEVRGALVVDVDGYEGPLDLLLDLARSQKVDLRQISILALVEQYLTFIAEARRMRLELAADYLVMAAWLAYLKSRLMLPKTETPEEEPSGEELADRLAARLAHLEAMRLIASRLMEQPRLGQEVFARGAPERMRWVKQHKPANTLYDLLKAYATQRTKDIKVRPYQMKLLPIFAIDKARHRLEAMLGSMPDWCNLETFLLSGDLKPEFRAGIGRRSVRASAFSAGLELAKEGRVELRQNVAFGTVEVRAAQRRDLEAAEGREP